MVSLESFEAAVKTLSDEISMVAAYSEQENAIQGVIKSLGSQQRVSHWKKMLGAKKYTINDYTIKTFPRDHDKKFNETVSDVLDLPAKHRGYVALPAVGAPMQTKYKAARGDGCHLGNKQAPARAAKEAAAPARPSYSWEAAAPARAAEESEDDPMAEEPEGAGEGAGGVSSRPSAAKVPLSTCPENCRCPCVCVNMQQFLLPLGFRPHD